MTFFAVVGLALLMTRAFGSHAPNTCESGDVFVTGYGYGYSGSGPDGTGYGYGYGPCPSPPVTTPVGTITLVNSQGNQTASFRIGESGNRAVLDGLQPSTRYDIDFAQSPGVIIGQGTTDANGDATITFAIPATARVGAATLTFLPGGSTTNSRTLSIQIVAAQTAPTATPTNATPTAVPVSTPVPVSTTVPTLPRTGFDVGTFLLTSAALVAVGMVLSIKRRRPLDLADDSPLPSWFAGRSRPEAIKRGMSASVFGRDG